MNVTAIICIVTAFISWQALSNQTVFLKIMHFPFLEKRNKEYHRFFTSMFVHGSWNHLFVNLFVFFQIGSVVELHFVETFGDLHGRIKFLILYLLSGILADIPTYLKHQDNQHFSSVGASGAVAGILFSYAIFTPWAWFLFPPLPAFGLAIFYLWYSSWASKKTNDHIDHEAHFWGGVAGFLLTIAFQPSLFTDFIAKMMQPEGPFN